jgi:hypothetical protein
MRKTIFRCIVGSQAYGTNVEGSDIDIKGVYIEDEDKVLGFGYCEQYEVGKDECYYEIRRFLQLLETANPTVLEMLYVPEDCILEISDEFREVVKIRDLFLTKKCLNSFGGYAVAQIKKARGLEKKMNWENSRVERKGVLDFCYVITPLGSRLLRDWLGYQKGNGTRQEYYGVVEVKNARDLYMIYLDKDGDLGYKGIVNEGETSNELRLSSIPVEEMINGHVMSYNKDGYMRHCKDYNSYQEWLLNRNTGRYVDSAEHGQKIDGKNLMHCRRLLDMAIEIARDGFITVRRPDRDRLLAIRRGMVKLEDVIKEAEDDVKGLDWMYENSDLPDDVNREVVNNVLLKIRKYGKG